MERAWVEPANGMLIDGRPGNEPYPNHKERFAGPVSCSAGFGSADSSWMVRRRQGLEQADGGPGGAPEGVDIQTPSPRVDRLLRYRPAAVGLLRSQQEFPGPAHHRVA